MLRPTVILDRRREAVLCAHTIRRLKPGKFEEFAETFTPGGDEAPEGWVAFHMLRSLSDENEVITFGFFDGTLEELERNQDEHGYAEMRDAVAPLVDEVVSNGVYEVMVSARRDDVAA
jgi:hypothetical protein